MERFVAIDNVCAWPNLTLLPDGSIAAVIFNQPTHGGWEGDVECWVSKDGGRGWTRRGVPAPHEPQTNRMNVAAGLARDGSLVVLASGWSRRQPPGQYSSPHEGEVLAPWVCRSADAGETWERGDDVAPPEGMNRPAVPFGDIIPLADDALGACLYGPAADNDNAAWLYESLDDGRSWRPRAPIRGADANETALLALPDGRLLAAARTRRDQHIDLLRSDDDGRTWRLVGPVTLPMQHPGHLLLLRDGSVLLTYGVRNKGFYGVAARVSRDAGETWSAPRFLVNFETASDGGYPATAPLADGTLATAYYCNSTPAHQRYHMGVARWRIEE